MADRRGGCVLCGEGSSEPIGALRGLPRICHRPSDSADAARAVARADVRLVRCGRCGHVYNAGAVPPSAADYSGYDNALHFSPAFRRFADDLADRLDRRWGLADRTVVELGCGDGDFLRRLARRGARAIGFDPALPRSVGPGRAGPPRRGASVVVGGLPSRGRSPAANMLVARHVLEHVRDPRDFLCRLVRLGTPGGAFVYLEVPNATEIWRTGRIWDLIPEHVSYFDRRRLDRLLGAAGLRRRRVRASYGRQFLSAEAETAGAPTAASQTDARPSPALARFASRFETMLDRAARTLAASAARDGPAVVWGAGSKTCTYLNAMAARGVPVGEAVAAVVDVNPRKRGRFLAGTGHPIVAPPTLAQLRPRTILVANPLYLDEAAMTARAVGRAAAWVDRIEWRAL